MKDNQNNPEIQGNQKDKQAGNNVNRNDYKPDGTKTPGSLDQDNEKTRNTREFADTTDKTDSTGKPTKVEGFAGENPDKLNTNKFTDEQSRNHDRKADGKKDGSAIDADEQKEPGDQEYEDPEHPHEYDTPRAESEENL
jgi:hypothetical protein